MNWFDRVIRAWREDPKGCAEDTLGIVFLVICIALMLIFGMAA